MRILIACEFSGVVRQAFANRGHQVVSCDLLPSEDNSAAHYTGRIENYLGCAHWDLLIAHPPCTYLCNSGVRWLAPKGKLNPERHCLMQQACDFFALLYHAKADRVCIENPIMHKYARDYLKSAWKVPSFSQSIQPFEHGHGETKRTCLWLRGLPLLQPSNLVIGRSPRIHHASPSPDRWKLRSRTLQGIAHAMTQQWG